MKYGQNRKTQRSLNGIKLHTDEIEEVYKFVYLNSLYNDERTNKLRICRKNRKWIDSVT